MECSNAPSMYDFCHDLAKQSNINLDFTLATLKCSLGTITLAVHRARKQIGIGIPSCIRGLEKTHVDMALRISQVPCVVGAPWCWLAQLLAVGQVCNVGHRVEVVAIIASINLKTFYNSKQIHYWKSLQNSRLGQEFRYLTTRFTLFSTGRHNCETVKLVIFMITITLNLMGIQFVKHSKPFED